MQKILNFREYAIRIIIVVLSFIYLPILFGSISGDSTLVSYIIAALCFFLLLILAVGLVLRDGKFVRFYAISYIVQLVLGVAHYLYFVDAGYFAGNGGATSGFWHEFLTTFTSIEMIHNNWRQLGLLSMVPSDEFYMTHREIWHIIAYPFYFFGHKWLNYAPLNAFSSLFASANLVFIFRNQIDSEKLKYLRNWTAYFPLFLCNDYMWRDAFGLMLMSVGLVMVYLAKNPIAKFLSFVWFGFGAFIQRTMYLVLVGGAIGYGYIKKQKNGVLKILSIFVSLAILFVLLQFTQETNDEDYNSTYINSMSFLALPVKIVFGLIGPFPWIQFFKLVEHNPAFAWQLEDYILGTFQFGYLLAIIFNYRNISFKNLDVCTIFGFGIMLSGFVTSQMHIGYIAEGLYFTLPWFFNNVGSAYKRFFNISLFILVILNVVVLAMGNLSISSLWK